MVTPFFLRHSSEFALFYPVWFDRPFFEEKMQKESEKEKIYTCMSDFTHQQAQMHLKFWVS